jgi:hypothetical protein
VANNESRCIIELKLYTEKWQADKLNDMFYCAERMYNNMIRYAVKQLAALRANKKYKDLLSSYVELLKKETRYEVEKSLKKELSAKLNEIVKSYELSEYQFHSYITKMKNESFEKVFDINTAQKIATHAWQAVANVLYDDGEKLHFKKLGDMQSFEGKTNKSGIRFDKTTNRVKIGKMSIPIKLRKNDTYAHEMLEKPICYCRIVRKPFKAGYKYFVQLILKGEPVKVPELGVGDVGLDQGTSTVSAAGDDSVMLEAHGITDNKTMKDYNKEIIHLSRKLERSQRLNNPDNYNEDGTIKSGKLTWVRTKNYYRILFRLKDAYRRKAAFVKQLHNKHANQILRMGDVFYTEPMNWKALQKRSKKPIEKSDKELVVTTKTGQSKKIRKNKKKRRFGKSLENHSPALFESILIQKLGYYGKKLNYVNLHTYKASQYNPETKEYNKAELNERVKRLFNKLIQRDLLSAFLLQNPMDDLNNIDINKVELKIDKFIAMHDACMAEMATKPNMPECMGLKHLK